jgi:hypothetical protein
LRGFRVSLLDQIIAKIAVYGKLPYARVLNGGAVDMRLRRRERNGNR